MKKRTLLASAAAVAAFAFIGSASADTLSDVQGPALAETDIH
jgi:hypothetical protein